MASLPRKKPSTNNATPMEVPSNDRFLDVDPEPQRMLMPIEGYQNMPLVPLEKAVKRLQSSMPYIGQMAKRAKEQSKREPSLSIPLDQVAAIKLFTMEYKDRHIAPYFKLNEALRDESREKLKPWFSYLKLLLTGLSHIPSTSRSIFRGVKRDLRKDYLKGETVTWWGLSSCTSSMEVLRNKEFLGSKGPRTLFFIESFSAKSIKQYSAYKREDEFLLPPARHFEVMGCLPQGVDLFMIHLKEMEPLMPLIEPLTMDGQSDANNDDMGDPSLTEENESTAWDRPTRGVEIPLTSSSEWSMTGTTVAGLERRGFDSSRLLRQPRGLYVDDDQTIYVVDAKNHRVVAWSPECTEYQVIAGGNGEGGLDDQLNNPTDVIVDRSNDTLIISDTGNRRVVCWSRREGRRGKTIVSDISCECLTMDELGFLYVSDSEKQEVRRLRTAQPAKRDLVAGGQGDGNGRHQLSYPTFLFVDRDRALYVSDTGNHRVMKWAENAKVGQIVAGGNGAGDALNQLNYPYGVLVDDLGTVYVADGRNHRIMLWPRDASVGSSLIHWNDRGDGADQLYNPYGLSFDHTGNLYVSDWGNSRIQKFELVSRSQ